MVIGTARRRSRIERSPSRANKLRLSIVVFAITVLTSSLLAVTSGAFAVGTVVAYPPLKLDKLGGYSATPSADSTISMTVGGTAVNVQDNLDAPQARFAMSNDPETVVITDTATVTSATIRPLADGITPVISGHTITFTLPNPEYFAVDINGVSDALLVFADPLESSPPQPTDSNVVNVTTLSGINNTGTTETAALQSALNYVSAHSSTTPILYFPAGVYQSAMLTVPSNVQLYLSSGAVLLADPNKSDWHAILPNNGDVGVPSDALLAVEGSSNVKIFGRGAVDGNGYHLFQALQSGGDTTQEVFDLYTNGGTNNLTVNDVLFMNSVGLQTHIIGSHDVSMSHVKFAETPSNTISPRGVWREDDALKIDGVYNLTFDSGWLSSRDDSMTFAATGTDALYNTSNVHVTHTVLDSSLTPSASIRFADVDSTHTMSSIEVSHIWDISPARGMIFRGDGGGAAYQSSWGGSIVLNDWDIENAAPLMYFQNPSANNVTISGLTLSNITSPNLSGGVIIGATTDLWQNIHFQNVVNGGVVASDFGSLGLTVNSYATNIDVSPVSSEAPYAADLAINETSRPTTISSTSVASGQSASAAADGNFGTYFKSAVSPSFPQYLTVTWTNGTLLTPHAISGVTLVCDHCQGQAPTSWDVQVSATGSAPWTTVASYSNPNWLHNDSSYESRLVSFQPVTAEAVRVQIDSAQEWGNEYQIDEIEVTPANTAPAASASTTSIGSGYVAASGGDGDWGSYFKSASSPTFPQYFNLEWPVAETVGAVNLVCDFCQGQAPTKWEVQASADGVTNWTTVASSGSNPIAWSRNDGTRETHVVSFPTVTAKGLRLQIDSANLAWGSYQIDEVEVAPATAAASAYVNVNSGLCLDDPNGYTYTGVYLQIWTCLNDPQQQWVYTSAREMMVSGDCLDNNGHNIATLNPCNGNASQQWIHNADGDLVEVSTGYCLDTINGGTALGTQISLYYCEYGAGDRISEEWSHSS